MRWQLYDPSTFHAGWHDAMQAGEGRDKVMQRFHTAQAAKIAQLKVSLFYYSLRNYPLHLSAQVYAKLKHRTRLAYNHNLQRWELLLTSRKFIMDELESLEKNP